MLALLREKTAVEAVEEYPNMVWNFCPAFEQMDYVRVITELAVIVFKYQSWRDSLSQSIHYWSADVIRAGNQLDIRIEISEILKIVQQKIEILRQEILISPLDGCTPLEDPILVEGEAWERWQFQDFCSTIDLSLPFEPHAFGKEILCWSCQFPPTDNLTPLVFQSRLTPIPRPPSDPLTPQEKEWKKIYYMQLLERSKETIDLRLRAFKSKNETGITLAEVEKIKEEIKNKLAQEKRKAHQHAAEQQRLLEEQQRRGEEFKASTDRAISALEDHTRNLKGTVKELGIVVQEEKNRGDRLEADNASLRNQLQQLRNQPSSSNHSTCIIL